MRLPPPFLWRTAWILCGVFFSVGKELDVLIYVVLAAPIGSAGAVSCMFFREQSISFVSCAYRALCPCLPLRQTVVDSAVTSGDTTDYQTFDVGVHAVTLKLVPKFQRFNQWFSVKEVSAPSSG